MNTEAIKLIQKQSYSVEDWQQAKNKWQQAIDLLENIPAGTFVSEQTKDSLAACRLGHAQVVKRLTNEEKAFQRLQSATEVAQQAASMTTNSPYSLKDLLNAQSQWRLAFDLLSSIPSETALSTEAENQLIYYRNNFHNVSDALNQMKQCMDQSSYTETSCGYEVTVNIVMPPLATASNSDSQPESSENSEIVSYSDSDSSSTGSTYVRRYTRNSGLGSASRGSTYVQGYTRKDGTNVHGHYRSGSSSTRAGGFGSFRAGGASS